MENTKFYVTAEELSDAYGICLSKAYKLIRQHTPQQIENMKRELRRHISVIAERREECRNYAKYWERHNVPVYVNIWKQAAKEKTDQMKPLYQELRMCDELMKTGPLARANARFYNRKRNLENQYYSLS